MAARISCQIKLREYSFKMKIVPNFYLKRFQRRPWDSATILQQGHLHFFKEDLQPRPGTREATASS